MIRKLYFGQYVCKYSFAHKLDPRLKIIYVITLSTLIFAIDKFSEIALFSAFIVIAILLSKMDFRRLLKGLMPFYLISVFIALMYMIFARDKLVQGSITIWRFLILTLMSLILTFTTTISDLVLALEKLLKPLKIFSIRPRNIAVMVSIAIRFVPVMFLRMEKTKEAMLSRLANFRKLRHLRIFMLVLLEKMLKSASNLSDAMISRLYNEDIENTKALQLKTEDYISMSIIISLIIIIIY